jgi:tRNA-splicing ligase RtcB (3'-phosphate/5'-hydroxy nucleic acid ligase)
MKVMVMIMNNDYFLYGKEEGAHVKAWVDGVPIDPAAIAQALRTAAMPFIFKHVALMPDAHVGKGATVGTVIATIGAVVPAAVGVDIGCGMIAAQTTMKTDQLPDNLNKLRLSLEEIVPVGFAKHTKPTAEAKAAEVAFHRLQPRLVQLLDGIDRNIDVANCAKQLGTLGGGNHFIEVCRDADENVWIVLHSGSRGVGNQLGQFFIESAKGIMRSKLIQLEDPDLAYLSDDTPEFRDYLNAVMWAQDYAAQNRKVMMDNLLKKTGWTLTGEVVNCHHNYISHEHHFGTEVMVTRKGAVHAGPGVKGIIPGSMGVGTYIVEGLGNPESFNSCSHGAGRTMSRNEARKKIDIEQHIEATRHVECRKDSGIIDESPAAYKDLNAVIHAQRTLVKPIAKLEPIICIKG